MTDQYAVFGNPISHSKSPQIHSFFARSLGEEIEYSAIEAPLDGFENCIRQFFSAGGKGANVTVPFKLQAAQLADEARESARVVGAANCLKLENNRIVAENFDGKGLVVDIQSNLGIDLAGSSVLVLGSGGATRGAILPILSADVDRIVIANRTVSKAVAIADALSKHGSLRGCGYEELNAPYDIVLNATSASLFNEALPLPSVIFSDCALAYDMTYGKGLTPFLRQAKNCDTRVLADGVGMLVEQAAEAYAWWRGRRPETTRVIQDITVPLN